MNDVQTKKHLFIKALKIFLGLDKGSDDLIHLIWGVMVRGSARVYKDQSS
jgi:hypothetical protein